MNKDDTADYGVMLELATVRRTLGVRATFTPITLATIGLPWEETKRIARELRDLTVEEYPAEDFEHVTLESDDYEPEEEQLVPADWFAGGFCDNH